MMAKSKSPRYPSVPNDHWGFAQSMRKEPTPSEELLWNALRREKLGVRFRRQHPLGPFIADFVCLTRHLVIELDGSGHNLVESVEYDAARDEYLRTRGLRVIRFKNEEVLSDITGVLDRLREFIERQP